MARCLIVGCGCHGQRLVRELGDRGHVVRGSTRTAERMAAIAAAGAEPVLGDPDRLATLVPALDHVSVAILLLGSATGDAGSLAALHGPRLEALLVKLLDTTIRGVVYEAAGSVSSPLLRDGAGAVARLCGTSRIPYQLVEVERESPDWLGAMADGVEEVLAPPRY